MKLTRIVFPTKLVSSLLLCCTAFAGSVTKPNTFSAGEAISSKKVNENFDTLFTELNRLGAAVTPNSSGDITVSRSVVPGSGEADGSLGWIKFYENVYTNSTGSLVNSISANGDVHHNYMIEMDGYLNGVAGSRTYLRINGATSSYNSYWQHFGGGSSLYNDTGGFMLTLNNGAAYVHTVAYLSAVNGTRKVMTGNFTLNEGSAVYFGPIGGVQLTDTSNLTSIAILTNNAQTFTGRITIYRKR